MRRSRRPISKAPFSAYLVMDHLLATLDVGETHFTVCDIRESISPLLVCRRMFVEWTL